jgi:hypothetical protein
MKVIEGRDGWLFLDNDSNRTWDQFEGRLRLSLPQIDEWSSELFRRAALQCGRFRFAISPSKETVYPEFIPSRFKRAIVTPIDVITRLARGAGFHVELRDELSRAKQSRDVYDEGDTHWNQYGALIAANMLLRAVGLEPYPEDACAISTRFIMQDLGRQLDPPRETEAVICRPKNPTAYCEWTNGVTNRGHMARYVSALKEKDHLPKMMIFGDSFADGTLPFLSERAAQLIRIHTTSVDRQMVKDEAPDVVFSLVTERFLIAVPESCETYSVSKEIEAKRSERKP